MPKIIRPITINVKIINKNLKVEILYIELSNNNISKFLKRRKQKTNIETNIVAQLEKQKSNIERVKIIFIM